MGRSSQVRASNDRVAEQGERYRFESRVPMLCECSAYDCRQLFLITLDEYRAAREQGYLTAPGHRVEDAKPIRKLATYWLQ